MKRHATPPKRPTLLQFLRMIGAPKLQPWQRQVLKYLQKNKGRIVMLPKGRHVR